MTTESGNGNRRRAANVWIADDVARQQRRLHQLIRSKDELHETPFASLDYVVLRTTAAMRSATEVLM